MNLIYYIYKTWRKIKLRITDIFDYSITWWHLKGNNASFSSFISRGIPYIMISRKGKMTIGQDLFLNNGLKKNPIGYSQRCTFFVDADSSIIIGNSVGISQSALISTCSIRIGDHVKIGGGCHIFTTDFHSLDPNIRKNRLDQKKRISAPIEICDNVFIGAGSTILKGVRIGENSVIGASSVVTKDIPANQIWAGNPARFIRNIE